MKCLKFSHTFLHVTNQQRQRFRINVILVYDWFMNCGDKTLIDVLQLSSSSSSMIRNQSLIDYHHHRL
ncbi:hypothetical protein DERF_005114 [Dermatophagoides farinae]|uniref:Uncharacterized protein n=1 Tax=Dermatophagoides farinae TaxID=6954 RepID=A0A922L688_DERFA|nr:hypothetical protein DERF_005114 [Dermatophagoides farinae]